MRHIKRGLAMLFAVIMLAGCQGIVDQGYQLPAHPYTPQDFTEVNGYLTCTAGNAVMGIDVSSHQGEIDWQKVASAGVKFAFVRLGYRGYDAGALQEDAFAKENLRQAKAAGLIVGAYFFSQAITEKEAREEASYALEVLDGIKLDLPLVYDWEYVSDSARTGTATKETVTACTLAFCKAVEMAGYDAMVYANTDQIRRLLDMEKIQEYPLWLAKYNLNQEFPCKADLWQYTQEGSLPGISGKVDINLLFTDYGLGKTVFGE